MYSTMTPGWQLGKWLVICDRCGFKKTNDQVAKEPWTGLRVCKDTCWEPRHPQEFVRPRPDEQAVPFTRPEPTDQTTSVTYDQSGAHHTKPSGTFNNEI